MDTTQPITLLINRVHCDYGSNEWPGTDEVFFRIYEWKNGDWAKITSTDFEHYHVNPIRMKKSDNFNDATVDIAINVTFTEKLKFQLWECDKPDDGKACDFGSKKDKWLGNWILDRTISLDNNNTSGKALDSHDDKCDYKLFWRVIKKPIPAVRVMGVYCYESSKGINTELAETVINAAEEACEAASKLLKESPRPRAKAMSKAFKKADEVLEELLEAVLWIADAAEGKDEVYLQHVEDDTASVEGGGFWPTDAQYYQMDNGDEVYFTSDEDETKDKPYYRFPLDKGDVSIQLREWDPTKANVMGAFTFNQEYYDKYAASGEAQCLLCDQYLVGNGNNQGAIYYIVASVGIEDFAKEPKVSAQEG